MTYVNRLAKWPADATPKCFYNRPQFVSWLKEAKHSHGCNEAAFCTDCTPEYKAKMLAQNRCEFPDIEFVNDQDGFLQGVIPNGAAHTSFNTP